MRRWIIIASTILIALVIILVFYSRKDTIVPTFTFVNIEGQEVLKSQETILVLSKTLNDKQAKNSNLILKKKVGIVGNGANLYQFLQDGKTYIIYEYISPQKPFIGSRNMEDRIYEYKQ